jgi:serine/threonine protein kinase/WD40 repeat protein
MPVDAGRVQAAFLAAVEQANPMERAAVVDRECGADTELRSRVEALLRAGDEPDDYLDRPMVVPTISFAEKADPLAIAGVVLGGRYKLLEEIGEGGMGAVWLAQQTEPVRRLVAVKLIKTGMDTRQVVARFEAERQALALMDHPNIAKVHDAGKTDTGRPYFVMELVKGVPITKYCDEHHLTPRQRLELFVPVCLAIQHAHQKGIIHRDIKPSNVLVTTYDDRPAPKVIDFGVAKATGQQFTEQTLHTGIGTVVGTVEYMSPEQASLNSLDVDTRSDIYSLGVLLYELLTGGPPFSSKELEQAGMLEMFRVIREIEPSKPSTRIKAEGGRMKDETKTSFRLWWFFRHPLSSFIPHPSSFQELDWIVLKALEKDRSRRYDTANGLARDLQRYLADEPVQACPPSASYRLRKFVRRNKGPVLAATLVVLALVGGILGATWGMIRATKAEAVAVGETEEKKIALEAAQASERDARDQLFLALWNQARAGRFSRQMGQRLDSLAAVSKAAQIRRDERLRDEAIAAMALPDVRPVPGWHSTASGPAAIAYSTNYELYARVVPPGYISIRTIPDDREIQKIISGPITGTYLYFSPDDRFLVGLVDRRLRVWRVSDGRLVIRDDSISGPWQAFSSDGRWLAICQKASIVCFELATFKEVKRWSVPWPPYMLAFHPDNNKLAVGFGRSSFVSVYDAAQGKLLVDLPVGTFNDQVVAWHPDGERLAVTGTDPRIQIWNVTARRKVATLEGHVKYVATLTFHPDGNLLASHGWDGMLLLWDPPTGRQLMRFAASSAPRFSANGRWLGVARHGDRAELLEVTPSNEYRTLVSSAGAGRGGYNFGDISKDGRLLILGMDDGARVWDLHNSSELVSLPAGNKYAFFDYSAGSSWRSAPTAILTGGSAGLLRWPLNSIASSDRESNSQRLGPPQQLSPLRRAWFARNPDGRTLAVATEEGGANKLVDPESGTVLRELGAHPLGEVRALSPDGQWAASSGWHSDRVRLRNARTGEMVRQWVTGFQNYVHFTPDSRTLIIGRGDGFSFWDIETLQPTFRLTRDVVHYPGHVAFSPDGKTMALEMEPGTIHLKHAATGHTFAKLEDPHGDRATWQGFTPDGAQLVVASSYSSAVHIWDLRLIRKRLVEMGLDWDGPALPDAAKANIKSLTIQVELGKRGNKP